MEKFKNKVVASDYVKKNYIKKQELLEWLEKESNLCKDKNNPLIKATNDDFVEGIVYSYIALSNYLKEK